MKIVELTDENFQREVIESETPVLVDFWAVWCGPCKAIAPAIEEIARDYDGKLKVGKLNVDLHQNVTMQYGIRSIPTLMVFKNGQVVEQIVGGYPKQQILSKVTPHIAPARAIA
jgi:thioredoxin 1